MHELHCCFNEALRRNSCFGNSTHRRRTLVPILPDGIGFGSILMMDTTRLQGDEPSGAAVRTRTTATFDSASPSRRPPRIRTGFEHPERNLYDSEGIVFACPRPVCAYLIRSTENTLRQRAYSEVHSARRLSRIRAIPEIDNHTELWRWIETADRPQSRPTCKTRPVRRLKDAARRGVAPMT